MAGLNIHSHDCESLIGNNFIEIHRWLDEYAVGEIEHRDIRHNLKGVQDAYKLWGSEASVAALIHILRDKDGYRPTMQEVKQMINEGIPEIDWSKN